MARRDGQTPHSRRVVGPAQPMPLLENIDIPVHLGCDWDNVPLHLPSTFTTLQALSNSPEVRVGMLGEYGLTWPWESKHREALAWYDH